MKSCRKLYRGIIHSGNFLQPFLLLALRLFWGYAFFQAGLGKFENMDRVMQFFESLGIPFVGFNAYLVASTELVGGVMLFFGVGARLAAIPLSINMIVALLTAHSAAVGTIMQDPQNFINQLPFNYLLASLIILAFGPGMFSIDALLKRAYKS